jgi:hypothetical protein
MKQEEEKLTDAQVESRKKEMIAYYKSSMDFLKIQKGYEQLQLDLDEIRFKRASIQYQLAQMYANMNPEETDKESIKEELKEEIKNS